MQKHSKIFAWAVVAVIVAAAAVTLLCGGLNLSQALSGGYSLKMDIGQEFELADLENILSQQSGIGNYNIVKAGDKMDQCIIHMENVQDEGAAIVSAVQEQYPDAKFRGCDPVTRSVPRMTLVFFGLAGLVTAVVAGLYFAVRYGIPGGVGTAVSCLGTMVLLLGLALIARLTINTGMLAAFLAVFIYSLMDTGIYFEQLRAPLRAGEGEELLEAQKAATKACRLQRALVAFVGAAMFLAAFLLGEKTMASMGICAFVGVLSSAACTGLLGSPAAVWAKRAFSKGRKTRKKVKAIR